MNPESVERAKGLQFNSQMMEGDPALLPDRVEAHLAAMGEMQQAYLDGADKDSQLPANFDNALDFATSYLYRTGNPDFGEDLKRHMGIDLDKRMRDAKEGEWLPQDEGDLNLVQSLIELGSRLGDADEERAFQPRREADGGRPWEITDPYDGWYNKYGFFIRRSQKNGSFM